MLGPKLHPTSNLVRRRVEHIGGRAHDPHRREYHHGLRRGQRDAEAAGGLIGSNGHVWAVIDRVLEASESEMNITVNASKIIERDSPQTCPVQPLLYAPALYL